MDSGNPVELRGLNAVDRPAGDTARYSADVPHEISNETRKAASALMVVICDHYDCGVHEHQDQHRVYAAQVATGDEQPRLRMWSAP